MNNLPLKATILFRRITTLNNPLLKAKILFRIRTTLNELPLKTKILFRKDLKVSLPKPNNITCVALN